MRKEVAHTVCGAIRKGSRFAFDERAPDARPRRQAPCELFTTTSSRMFLMPKNPGRSLYWLEFTQSSCTIPTQGYYMYLYNLETTVYIMILTRSG